jgi:LysM repeat protein
MNNESPLVPQGPLAEQKNQGRARVKIAVFVVLAIHGVGLLALLMQGCKPSTPPPEAQPQPEPPTNSAPAFAEPTNTPAGGTNQQAGATAAPGAPAAPTQPQIPEPTVVTPPAPPAGATEYKIVSGDTFGNLAKKFHVSVKAIVAANPGVEPTKLKIGQTIHIPGPESAPPSATGGSMTSSTPEATPGEQAYSVKSGDTLGKIATQFGITVKALRSANSLKTDKIKVGQKLKIPAKAAGSVPVSVPTSVPSADTTPSTQPPPSGAGTTTPAR